MHLRSCLFLLAALAAVAHGQIPAKYRGDWLLVNGVMLLHLDDASMVLRNTGTKGAVSLKDDGTFTWHLPEGPRTGRFADGRLLLANDQVGAPKWMALLEFRPGSKEAVAEVMEYALRQQNQFTASLDRVRRSSIEKAILNNLRQLAAASDQYFLETGLETVKLEQLVGPDNYIRKLTPVDGEDYRTLDLAKSAKFLKIVTQGGITVSYER